MIVMHGVQAVAILHLSPRAGMLPAVFIIRLRRLFIERAGRVGPLSAYATM